MNVSNGLFLSTLSLRRATFRQNYECFEWIISIHALLAESDGWTLNINGPMKISIHALLAESDRAPQPPQGESSIFLSTLSLRRATCRNGQNVKSRHISIHALLAESDTLLLYHLFTPSQISIHALLAESDRDTLHTLLGGYYFYPRSPCGERRWLRCWQLAARDISIHALLAESDNKVSRFRQRKIVFLSTLSLRRATI